MTSSSNHMEHCKFLLYIGYLHKLHKKKSTIVFFGGPFNLIDSFDFSTLTLYSHCYQSNDFLFDWMVVLKFDCRFIAATHKNPSVIIQKLIC